MALARMFEESCAMLRMHAGGPRLPSVVSARTAPPPPPQHHHQPPYPLFINVFSVEPQQALHKSCTSAAQDAMRWDAWESTACIASEDDDYVRVYHNDPMPHDDVCVANDDEDLVLATMTPPIPIDSAGMMAYETPSPFYEDDEEDPLLPEETKSTKPPPPEHEEKQVPHAEALPVPSWRDDDEDDEDQQSSPSSEDEEEEEDELFIPTSRDHRCKRRSRAKKPAKSKAAERKNAKHEKGAAEPCTASRKPRKRFPPHIKQWLDDALLSRTLFPDQWMCAGNPKLTKFMPKVVELSERTGLSPQQIRNYMHNNARKGRRLAMIHSEEKKHLEAKKKGKRALKIVNK